MAERRRRGPQVDYRPGPPATRRVFHSGGRTEPPPRWVIVVQPEKRAVYEDFRWTFELDDGIEVILDRRRGERRRMSEPVRSDRRRRPRRQPLPATEQAFAQHAGFFLVVRKRSGGPGT